MSAPNCPASPPRPSSASLNTTSTASTSSPTTTRSIQPPPPSTSGPLSPSASASTSSAPANPTSTPLSSASPPGGARPRPHPRLPPPMPTPSQTAQARDALVASLGNALDVELQGRAALLHGNARALAAQERDVQRALEDLRREDDRLLKVLGEGSRKVKELGDVQNWAERLERDFLVVEETMRLVRDGSESGSWSGSGSASWSGSESGSEMGDVDGGEEEEEGHVRMSDGGAEGTKREEGDVCMSDGDAEGTKAEESLATAVSLDKGKGNEIASPSLDLMDVDPAPSSPIQHDTAQDSGSSSVVTAIKAPEQARSAAASPSPSPGVGSWFKRFSWRR